jgi:hypothetical protein
LRWFALIFTAHGLIFIDPFLCNRLAFLFRLHDNPAAAGCT